MHTHARRARATATRTGAPDDAERARVAEARAAALEARVAELEAKVAELEIERKIGSAPAATSADYCTS